MIKRQIESFLVCDIGRQHDSPRFTLSFNELIAKKLTSSDILFFHYAFLDQNADRIMSIPCKKILVYHNITPSHFFREVGQDFLADCCDQGREYLGRIKGCFEAAIGDSAYNAAELSAFGHFEPQVIPVFYNNRFFSDGYSDNEAFLERRLAGEVGIAFIGRYVPNKRLDNLIRIAAVLKDCCDLPVRLRLHGKVWDREYFISLRHLAEELGVEQNISFELNQPQSILRTSLASATAFVSASEHEGFMVPLVEAFSAGCPVVALASSAVTETCGSAGCLVRNPDVEEIAGHIALVHQDRDLRAELIRNQSKRADYFSEQRTLGKWDILLRNFLDRPLVDHAHRI